MESKDMEYTTSNRVKIGYELPMNEMIFDFHDKLKSISRGYASMDYEVLDNRIGDLVKVDILVNGDKVDALALICHRSQAPYRAVPCAKAQGNSAKQMFQIALQAAIAVKLLLARVSLQCARM